MNMTMVNPAPGGVVAGFELGLTVLLLGGVPAALVAAALSSLRRHDGPSWSSGWANVFLAGFVFQVSSLAFTAFVFLMVVWPTVFGRSLSPAELQQVLWRSSAPAFGVLCGVWGVRCWRVLQQRVESGHTTIGPHQAAR